MQVTTQTLGTGPTQVTVTLYLPDAIADFQHPQMRPLAIILPGGGFDFHSQRESEPMALAYAAQGFAAVTVAYRLTAAGPVLPVALWQIATVVAYYHDHAAELHLASDHIILAGFSAGGYLAALYADLWADPALATPQILPVAKRQVSALALAYPVIGLRLGWPKLAAKSRAIHGDFTRHEADQLVTSQNPPTFIWATQTDETVPVQNTLAYLTALTQHKIATRAQIYESGPHGLALARSQTAFPVSFRPTDPTWGERYCRADVAQWLTDELAWLARLWRLDAFWREQ
ncbi:alpha/beta hydrolase [Levilactobacillus suantsaii]|uniref:Alpha/beta hydrolase n=1 Tax=Levilactobacillus suantsaii TaxID=2292255 RepID=A0A4Q0VFK8_9LACO|nr:alpha/beta hydrolase [Levilactobacillus suantsaii]QMU08697.1 alpha/beta hydrolase [Levilactobacillus suantsaii]RXI76592.1 alpha/beta hydrolase [Levilactobacillus suantsaii]